MVAPPAMSITASVPSTSRVSENTARPSRDGGRRGFGGRAGAVACPTNPGYGYGLVDAYGPCGAKGGRYPPAGWFPTGPGTEVPGGQGGAAGAAVRAIE